MLGEQAGKGRKVTASMGDQTEERKGQKARGEAKKIPSPSPSLYLTTGRKALYAHGAIQHVPPPSLVCKEERGSCTVPWWDQAGNRLLGLEKSSLPQERHPVGSKD